MIPPANKKTGFTLVEILIVLVLIGLLTGMALPAFNKIREKSYAGRMCSDFRTIVSAFEVHLLESGSYPPDSAGGAVPFGMDGALPYVWSQGSCLGGTFAWSSADASVRLVGASASTDLMLSVDEQLDDGNLATGIFQNSGGTFVYFVE